MKYSFIGLGKPIGAVNTILRSQIKSYRKAHFGEPLPLEAGGVFASNLSAAALFAGENDMCVYQTVEELLLNSDIIFVFLSDKALKSISLSFGKLDLKNKIFCHVSPAFSADILDFNSRNSYVSLFFPYFKKDEEGRTIPGRIIAEGYGKRLYSFKEALNALSIDFSFVTAQEKLMYITGATIAKDFPLMLEYTAKRLIKYSLSSDTELADELMEMAKINPMNLNSYNPAKEDNSNFALKQLEALENLGINDITRLYSSLLEISAHTKEEQSKETERIAMLAKRFPQQN